MTAAPNSGLKQSGARPCRFTSWPPSSPDQRAVEDRLGALRLAHEHRAQEARHPGWPRARYGAGAAAHQRDHGLRR